MPYSQDHDFVFEELWVLVFDAPMPHLHQSSYRLHPGLDVWPLREFPHVFDTPEAQEL